MDQLRIPAQSSGPSAIVVDGANPIDDQNPVMEEPQLSYVVGALLSEHPPEVRSAG